MRPGHLVEQFQVRVAPGSPGAMLHRCAQLQPLVDQPRQHGAQRLRIAGFERNVRIFANPAHIRRNDRHAAGQALEHAHRPAFIQSRDQHIVEVVVEVRHLVIIDKGRLPRPALPGEPPVNARHVHHVGDQRFALAARMIGAPDHADPHFRHERIQVHARRDRRHVPDTGLAQLVGIAFRHADGMLDIGGNIEIALAGGLIAFRMGEEGDLDRADAPAPAGIVDIILQVGRRIGHGTDRDKVRAHGDLARQLLEDPAAVCDGDVSVKAHSVLLWQVSASLG